MSKKTSTGISPQYATQLLNELGDEFVIIHNPNYVYAPYDICPLAPKITTPRERIIAIVQDMDGTTTTTETLCLHSLETMVRRFSGRLSKDAWTGLDRVRDYPHIIGNSTTKHVEYLVKTYQDDIHEQHFKQAYLNAALLTLQFGKDKGRQREVLANIKHFDCLDIFEQQEVIDWQNSTLKALEISVPEKVNQAIQWKANKINFRGFSDHVRAAIDIYYQRYHEILSYIETNRTEELATSFPDATRKLIAPMPGVAVFLATVKGWLGEDIDLFYDELLSHAKISGDTIDSSLHRKKLIQLAHYFQAQPVKLAIVTSSIAYEAHIVLTEVFKVLTEQISNWSISDNKKQMLLEKFHSCNHVFDGLITASDSSEIRLKPHRDLYSLALHQLGISKNDFDNVIGYEDSESGTIAIRAAGIGLCVAVPFADTQGHQLDYATYILPGGLPEALLRHYLFLSDDTLAEH